ncbi:MAG: sucrase ferredoxin [Synechococcales cyanobacterium CRU_2_2]|nr:sucrase ferredoxin [Synechococcales cyanobacterium CRU_2_2]
MPSLAQQLQSDDCRYCSVVSKSAGEDPIGTAMTADQWLIIEVPRPWSDSPWSNKPELESLLQVFESVERDRNLYDKLRILAIAPDKRQSKPGYSHVFHYRRPARLFARYQLELYCLPTEQVGSLAQALFFDRVSLVRFDGYRLGGDRRDVLVCTHTQVDLACGRFGMPLYKSLQRDYATDQTHIWQASHFGGHKFAPTLIDFPSGRFWGHLEAQHLKPLMTQTGDRKMLRSCYRGWSGLEHWGQVAERELWQSEGWAWFQHPKAGRVVQRELGSWKLKWVRSLLKLIPTRRARDLISRIDQKTIWAIVQISAATAVDQPEKQYYFKTEVSYNVLTQGNSGVNAAKKHFPQYRSTPLKQGSSI